MVVFQREKVDVKGILKSRGAFAGAAYAAVSYAVIAALSYGSPFVISGSWAFLFVAPIYLTHAILIFVV
ncbi:MAG: hypothetical protein V1875_05300 [Candidatus Altiarchaeota archaeon]